MKFKKICKICGKEFETNNPQKIYCDNPHYLPCPVCGKLVLKKDKDFSVPPKTCSSECRHILRKQNFKKKICVICGSEFQPTSGMNNICKKNHYIKCEICGKEFLLTSKMFHNNITTCSEECSKKKLENKFLEKYGTTHPMKNKEVQSHHKQSMKKKYGVEFALQKKDFVDKWREATIETNTNKYGVSFACQLPQCIDAQGKIISNYNIKFADKLESTGIKYLFEKRLGKYSYDICIPEQKILIEINPTYTHSSIPNHFNNSRDKDYHITKSKIAIENGYRCIHFQNTCSGNIISIGLFNGDELSQIMTFGKPRYNKKFEWELLRLCTKSKYTIVGGAQRLFKHFVCINNPQSIILYCDRSKFNGDVYEKLGMELSHISPPQKVWSKGKLKVTSNLLQSRGYDQLFKTNYGKGTSNEQLMLDNGWLPVYDCGQLVFRWSNNDSN